MFFVLTSLIVVGSLLVSSLVVKAAPTTSPSSSIAVQPGIVARFSATMLNNAVNMMLNGMQLTNVSIPDQTEAMDAAGKVNFTLSGLSLVCISRPSSSVTITPGYALIWTLQGAAVSISGTAKYMAAVQGFNVTMSGISIVIQVGVDPNSGRLNPALPKYTCSADSIKGQASGEANWIENQLIQNNAVQSVASRLKSLTCDALQHLIYNYLTNIGLLFSIGILPIGNNFNLNIGLVSAPLLGNNFVQTDHKGSCSYTGDTSDAPPSVPQMTLQTPAHDVTLYISPSTLNSLANTMHKHGMLTMTFNKNNLPSGSMFPEITSAYPAALAEIQVKTATTPQLTITANSAYITFNLNFQITLRQPDGTGVLLVDAVIGGTADVSATIQGFQLTGTILGFHCNSCNIISSLANGMPTTDQTKEMFSIFSQNVLLPFLNSHGQIGINLPTEFSNLIKPQLSFSNGVLIISIDFK